MALYDSSQLMNIVMTACANYTTTQSANNPFGVSGFNQINPSTVNLIFGKGFNPYANGNKSNNINFTTTSSSSNLSFSSNRALNAVQVAEAELAKGVRESSSNDSIDIRKYKNGAANGLPWCQYFTSYCYGAGQGSSNRDTFGFDGSTQNVKNKAIKAGYYAYKNSGYTPKKGDLAMWTKSASTGHVGIVSEVYPDGSFDVIEGNSGNAVRKHHYASQSSVGSTFDGFVKMSEWTERSNGNQVYYA